MKHIRRLLKDTYTHWNNQNPSRIGASLSYYALFSLAPLFVVLISLTGTIFHSDLIESRLLYQISTVVGSNVTHYIDDIIERSSSHGQTFISGLLGFGIFIFGATGVFKELSYSLDKMWAINPDKKPRRVKGITQILRIVKSHIPSLILIGFLTVLFMISIFSSISLQFLSDLLSTYYPNTFSTAQIIEPLISFVFVTVFFVAIYRMLPKTKLPWNELFFGAAVTAIVFLIGELLIGVYLGHYVDSSKFGAAASLISIMFWVYFSAQVFFLGASFTFNYSKRYGYLRDK